MKRKNFFEKIIFHTQRILFEKFALPKKQGENISKIILKKYLPVNPIIIDCGAHDGHDTVLLLKTLKGTIHAFEPVLNIYNRLVKRTAPDKNIHCYNIALSNETGMQDFYISEGDSDGSSSLLPPKDHLRDHPDTIFEKNFR